MWGVGGNGPGCFVKLQSGKLGWRDDVDWIQVVDVGEGNVWGN